MRRKCATTWKARTGRKWNGVMRQLLPENQEKRGGERGSWNPNGDRWGDAGGRLYVTCLSLYTLEVYYRHLPIYRHEMLASSGSGMNSALGRRAESRCPSFLSDLGRRRLAPATRVALY